MSWIYRFLWQARALYWRTFRPTTLGSRAIVVREESVCLVRTTYLAGWMLPGGGVDRGESYLASAVRETREECGLELLDARLFGLYLNRHHGSYDHVAVYVGRASGDPMVVDTGEIAEARFFPFAELPPSMLAGHRRRVEEYLGLNAQSDSW